MTPCILFFVRSVFVLSLLVGVVMAACVTYSLFSNIPNYLFPYYSFCLFISLFIFYLFIIYLFIKLLSFLGWGGWRIDKTTK